MGKNDALPLPLGGNVIHERHAPKLRKIISDILTASIQFSLDHRPEAVAHALQYARDMGRELADQFVGMYGGHVCEPLDAGSWPSLGDDDHFDDSLC